MATVPQYQIGQVKDKAVSGGFQQIQTNSDAFGAGIANAQIQQGQAISQLGDQAWQTAFQQRDIQDQATLRERDNLLSAKIRELISDDGGYLSLTGREAINAKASIEKQLEAYKKELGKGIDQRIVGKYNQVANQRLTSAFSTIDSHNRTQGDAWNKLEREVRISGQIQNSIAAFNDPGAMKLEFDLGIVEVNSKLLDVYGIDASAPKDDTEKAIIASETLKFTTKVHEGVISNLLANGRYTAAQTHFEDNKAAIDGTMYDDITTKLQAHTLTGETLTKVKEIRALGGSIAEQLVEARKITDPKLQEAVVSGIKARFNEDEEIKKVDQDEALVDAHQLIADGARTREDIDPDTWSRLSGSQKADLEALFTTMADQEDARQDEIKREKEAAAEKLVYGKLADGEVITKEDLMDMSGVSYYNYIRETKRLLLEGKTEKYQAVLNTISEQIAIGKTYGEIQKGFSTEWDQLEGVAKQRLKTILDATAEKNLNDSQTLMYNEALRAVAQGVEIGPGMYESMSGIQELYVKEKIQQREDQSAARIKTAKTIAEDDAYDTVLKHLVAGGSLEDLPEGKFDEMSGVQQTSITTAISAAEAKTNAASIALKQQEQYLRFKQMAKDDPAAFLALPLENYVGTVTAGNYNKLVDMQQSTDTVNLYSSQDDVVKMALGSIGYKDIDQLSVKKDGNGPDVRRFLNEIDVLTSAHFAETGKQPSQQEFKDIVTSLITDLVWNSNVGKDKQEPLILAMDEAEDLYIKVDRLDNSGKTDNVQLSEINDVDRAMFITVLNDNNIPVTAQAVAELSTVPSAEVTEIVKVMNQLNIAVSTKSIRDFYINTPN